MLVKLLFYFCGILLTGHILHREHGSSSPPGTAHTCLSSSQDSNRTSDECPYKSLQQILQMSQVYMHIKEYQTERIPYFRCLKEVLKKYLPLYCSIFKVSRFDYNVKTRTSSTQLYVIHFILASICMYY